MSDKFVELVSHYDLVSAQLKSLAEEARDYHSTEGAVVSSMIAEMMELKIKTALTTLKIP